MKMHIKQHLESITIEGLREFREESFIAMASAENCHLGVSGSGMYIVIVGAKGLNFKAHRQH